MIVYRIAQKPYISDLSGMGAFLYGGRWNSKGTHALYTAKSISLAYLEFIVHQFERDTWPKDLMISEIKIRKGKLIHEIEMNDLPINWNDLKYHGETQSVVTQWFAEGVLGIQVPSVIVPKESNVILNPNHPKYRSLVEIIHMEPMELDKRFGI